MLKRFAFATLAVAACATDSGNSTTVPQTDIQHAQIAAEISFGGAANGSASFDILLSKYGADPGLNAAQTSDCLRFGSDFTVTAGGTAATIDSLGGFDDGDLGFETNCELPFATLDLATAPQTIDIVLADNSAQEHVVLQSDGKGFYTVVRCDVDSCDLVQPPH